MQAIPQEPGWLEPAEGLRVLPLRTPTLPPATTTNTSFVGRLAIWIVDPATPWPEERARLCLAVRALPSRGQRACGIVLTHHHPDHVGAAAWLRGETGLPIHAHPRTAELLPAGLEADQLLPEGATVQGSDASDDRWEVLHTPGHASGHLVLWEPTRRLMIAGDMVAGTGTILIEPPDGHMATYLAQLARLRALRPTSMVPAHGPVLTDPDRVLAHYIAHRLEREARVLAALAPEPRELMDITRLAYPDVAPQLHPLAARSTTAHLLKLAEEGKAEQATPGRWKRT
jgi:glyoxylase-like metal-dependent hydrolase (beta-lactamase superfamily II)